jgi:hypothetical protein
MVQRVDDIVVDGVIVKRKYVSRQCQHVTPGGVQCEYKSKKGYPFCMAHLRKASIAEISLVHGKDLVFEDIVGRIATNPLEELSLLVSEVLLYKDYCAAEVSKLRGDYRYEGRSGEQLRAEVALYERSLDRAGKLLIEWSRLDIDERLTRIEEAKAAMLMEVIRRVLMAAELTDDQRVRAEETAVKELRALGR